MFVLLGVLFDLVPIYQFVGTDVTADNLQRKDLRRICIHK